MKISELLKKEYEGSNLTTYEVWQYTDHTKKLHSDFIKNIDEEYSLSEYQDIEVDNFYVMDESEYNSTILANSSIKADFAEWYDDKNAKILVVMIAYDIEL